MSRRGKIAGAHAAKEVIRLLPEAQVAYLEGDLSPEDIKIKLS